MYEKKQSTVCADAIINVKNIERKKGGLGKLFDKINTPMNTQQFF